MSNRWTKLAVAAAIVIAFVGVGSWLKLSNGKSGIAFAQVMERISSARTATFTMTTELPSHPSVTYKVLHMAPARSRMENPDGTVMICDGASRKILALIPALKKAVRTDAVGAAQVKPEEDPFDRLLQLRGADSQDLGQQEIDGRLATGFRPKADVGEWVVWVDPATEIPIRIEATYGTTPGMRLVMRDFAFNVDLDESLFSLEPPAGYTLDVQQVDVTKTPEERLVESLRICADSLGGEFPPRFDMSYQKEIAQKIMKQRKAASPDETMMQTMRWWGEHFFPGFFFVQIMPAESDWHYAGAGVKLGQAEVPVCWWKPAGSQTYRVVFGDLSVRDLNKADLDQLTAGQSQPK